MRHPYFALPTPIAIGHRGAAGERPENTLASFELAAAQGVAILESDVHATRDGEVVILHDEVLDRTTDGSGPVAERSLGELRELDAGYRFSPDGGRTFPFRGRGLRIPTLREAFEAFPGMRFNLEIKARTPGLVERTVDLVTEAGRENITLLAAGDDGTMASLRKHLRDCGARVAVGAALGDVLAFLRSARDGRAPPEGFMALQVPPSFGDEPLVTPAFVAHAHAHGIQVHVWTVNEREEMERMLDLGVDGVMSDFPGRLVEVIGARRASG